MLSEQEIKELAPQIPSWMIHEEEGIKRLICSFAFSSYEDSVNFTNKVAKFLYKFTFKYSHLVFFQNPDDQQFFRQLKIITNKQQIKPSNKKKKLTKSYLYH